MDHRSLFGTSEFQICSVKNFQILNAYRAIYHRGARF
jgi:hypothetical protein